jgi:3-oxoacyl-[acyl-carrier-protein] synthase-3
MKPIRGIGILGTGLWDGPVIGNDAFPAVMREAPPIDPYKGRRDDDGTLHIAGLALHPDRHARTLAALEKGFRDPFRGTRRRRAIPDAMPMSDAEAEAARHALAAASLSADDIDVLLVQSFLPDRLQPRNAALVADKIGLRHGAAWEVDSICNSAVSQLQVAASLVASGQARHVLCTQSVAYSRVRDPGVSASFQEGDMASAFVVGSSSTSELQFAWQTDGSLHEAIRLDWDAPTGAAPRRYWEQPRERIVIRWRDDLQRQVMSQVEGKARALVNDVLARAGTRIDEIDCFVTHQPMNWFVAFMEDVLGLRDGVAVSTFEEYANINSASVTASLHHAVVQRGLRRGARVLIFCPGAGYTYGAAVVRW